MYALFVVDKIEDYHKVSMFVAVSESRERLEDYAAREIAEYARIKELRARYLEIKKSLPTFDIPAPVKKKISFVPKTKQEHAYAAVLSGEYRKEHRAWVELAKEHDISNQRKAFEMLGADPSDETAVVRYGHPYEPPEFEIREAKVL